MLTKKCIGGLHFFFHFLHPRCPVGATATQPDANEREVYFKLPTQAIWCMDFKICVSLHCAECIPAGRVSHGGAREAVGMAAVAHEGLWYRFFGQGKI